MIKSKTINIPVFKNSPIDKWRKESINNEKKESIKNAIKKIKESSIYSSITTDNLKNWKNINIFSFRKCKLIDSHQIIFSIDENITNNNESKEYFCNTGLYVGQLTYKIGKQNYKISINSGYNNMFFNRMLNYLNNIYINDVFFGNTSIQNNENDISIFEYMFITKLKNAMALGYPRIIFKKEEKKINVKGKINLKKYISHDMFSDYKFSTIKKCVLYDQNIIDILYETLKIILKRKKNVVLRAYNDLLKIETEIKNLCVHKKVTRETFKKAYRSKTLLNPMYLKFKDVLRYAEFIIFNRNVFEDDNFSTNGVSGYLMDVTEIWENYLIKLLEHNLPDEYSIVGQEELNLYKGQFYVRTNYPDIVIKKNGETVAVLDAKFKKMDFEGSDVDREDLFQINHYTFYYYIKEKRILFSSLVYPLCTEKSSDTESERNNKNELIPLYGINDNSIPKFKIMTLKIPSADDTLNFNQQMSINEQDFIDEILNCIKQKS